MRTKILVMAMLGVLIASAACGGGTSSADKTATAEGGKPTVVATVAPTRAAAVSPTAAVKTTAAAGTQTTGTPIKVEAKDFAFTLDKSSAPAGSITFTATSTGPSEHEFVIFKTDLAPDKLPLVADKSKVDEGGAGVSHVDEIEALNVSDTKTLTVSLESGKYVLICNLPAHYAQGMSVAFTVQ